jgi:hypothetical protein
MSRNYQQDRDWREREGRNREGDNFPSRDDQDFMYGSEGGRSRRDAQKWRIQQEAGRGQNRDEMRRPSEQDRGYDRQEDRGQQRFENRQSGGDRGNYGYNTPENRGRGQLGHSEGAFGDTGYGGGRSGRGNPGYEGMTGSRWNEAGGGRNRDQNQGREGHSSQGQHTGRGPRNYKRSDSRIEEDVCERLTENGTLDASDIEVTVQNGEVTLKGNVENRQAKRLAEELAEAVSGVKDVTNQIKVQQQSRGEGERRESGATDTQVSGKNQQRKAS